MDLIVLVVYHGFFVAVVSVARYVGLAGFFIVDGDVHAEVIIVDDGEGPPVRQESQAFGLFDIPSLGTEVQDELFLSRYDFPVQAAVFEVSVIGDGRSAIQIDFVDEVLHDTVLFALFDHQELAMADGRDVAQLGGARVLIARIDRVGVHGRFFRQRVEFDDTRVFCRFGRFSIDVQWALDEGEDMAAFVNGQAFTATVGDATGQDAGQARAGTVFFQDIAMPVGFDDERSVFIADSEIAVFVDGQAFRIKAIRVSP